ncbi:MAG TPA: hydrogenase maturation protease [Candidatus Sulfotelmatobacter sp.]|nr:hydrogenase maturation protease [Candidatus Sulfotelmatobacter sp.]
MPAVLIVAYGNPLRCDDGVAWRAAEALRGKFPEDQVEVLCLHQLAPELAETGRWFECVIFMDAASKEAGKPGEIRVEEIRGEAIPTSEAAAFGHSLSPAAVLALAANLYGAKPQVFSVTVTGEDFGHGDGLSPSVAAAVPDLISRIELLVQSALSRGSLPSKSSRS